MIRRSEHIPMIADPRGNWSVMANLIIEHKLSKIAEVGVYKGESMRAILRSPAAEYIRDYVAVDPWEKSNLHWIGASQQDWDGMYEKVCGYCAYFPQLRVFRVPSPRAAGLFWDGYFDMVFIDGDHSYESATADIRGWLPKVRPGGIISGHDYTDELPKAKTYDVVGAVDDFFGKEGMTFFKGQWVWAKEVWPLQ